MNMVLFTLLALATLILVVTTLVVISIGGAIGTILFSDVIVCIVLLAFIIKKLFFKK